MRRWIFIRVWWGEMVQAPILREKSLQHETTFGLVGDGDDLDLLEWVEELFGITIEDAEAGALYKFQDLVTLVEQKTERASKETCLLAQGFRKLRDSGAFPADLCTPNTAVSELFPQGCSKDQLQELSELGGIDVKVALDCAALFGLSAWHWFMAGILSVSAIAFYVQSWLPFVVFLMLAVAAMTIWPTKLPAHIRTLGDLIRQALPYNYNRLASGIGPGNAADRRVVVEAICRDIASYSGPVGPGTTFIPKRRPIWRLFHG